MEGNEKWKFGGRDIFITLDGKEPIEITPDKIIPDKIILKDFEGYEYILDENGHELS
jgi:hypothetical protein